MVVLSQDVQDAPEATLRVRTAGVLLLLPKGQFSSPPLILPPCRPQAMCGAAGLAFEPAMLNWPAGPKPYDGLWAPWW